MNKKTAFSSENAVRSCPIRETEDYSSSSPGSRFRVHIEAGPRVCFLVAAFPLPLHVLSRALRSSSGGGGGGGGGGGPPPPLLNLRSEVLSFAFFFEASAEKSLSSLPPPPLRSFLEDRLGCRGDLLRQASISLLDPGSASGDLRQQLTHKRPSEFSTIAMAALREI